jgi:hypothetical protein
MPTVWSYLAIKDDTRQRIERADMDSPILIQRVTRRSQTWVRCSTSSVRGAFKRAWNLLRAYQPLPIRMIASHPKMIARYHNGSRRLPIVTSSSRDGSSGPGSPIRRSKPDDLGRVHREEAPEQQKGRSSRAASCSFSTVLSGSCLLPFALSRRFAGAVSTASLAATLAWAAFERIWPRPKLFANSERLAA